MKKKTMTILSIVLVVALTAVGFAAWLIVGIIEGDATGSFVANEYQDKYFTVSVNFEDDGSVADNKGKIIFGTPTGDAGTGKWLTYASTDPEEKLTATATIKFEPDGGFSTEKTMAYYLTDSAGTNYRTIRVAIDVAAGSDPAMFDTAVRYGYVAYPTATVTKGETVKEFAWKNSDKTTTYNGTDYTKFQNGVLVVELTPDMFTVDSSNEFATAQVVITFDWGTATLGDNPYTHFAKAENTPSGTVTVYGYYDPTENDGAGAFVDAQSGVQKTNKELASYILSYLREDIHNLQYSITLSEGTAVAISQG